MKKIAHFGAFDHDSYGDVLFPKILRFLLPEFEITHVAPTGIPTPWSDACPIISMEEAVSRTEWDGIVVGGGDIIQSGEWSTKKWKRHARLPFAHLSGLWTGAAFLSAKLNIPVAWMAPGVPTPFEPWYADCVKLALACSDHLMVRDQASRRFLDPFAEKPIGVVPDFALVLSRMWRISTSSASHVVLALSRADTKTRSGDVNALIRKLRQWPAGSTREVVVAPLMRWEYDEGSQDVFLKKNGIEASLSMECDTLEATARLIANSSGYIGNSLHGLVTAISYSVPAVLVYPELGRTPHKYDGFLLSLGLDPSLFTSQTWTGAFDRLRRQKKTALGAKALVTLDRQVECIRQLMSSGAVDKAACWARANKQWHADSEIYGMLGLPPEQFRVLAQKNANRIEFLSGQVIDLKRQLAQSASVKKCLGKALNSWRGSMSGWLTRQANRASRGF